MAAGMGRSKEPVSALLAGPYGHPYHPMLVTVPIGAWVISLGFDIASQVASKPGFLAQGSTWLIGAGLLGAVAAGLAGVLDLVVIPPGTRAFRTACTHMCVNLVLIFAYAGNFAWRYRNPSHGMPVDPRLVALSAASVIALAFSGYLGGKLTYRYGVRVASEVTQAEGFVPARLPAAGQHPAGRPRRGRLDAGLLQPVPGPAGDRSVGRRLGPDRRVEHHDINSPAHVGRQGGAELGIGGQARVIGGLDETPDEPVPDVALGPGAGVHGEHRWLAAAGLRVAGGPAEHLRPVARQPLHVLGMTGMGERVVQHRIGQAALVVSSGEGEERGLAARELEDR